LRLSRANVLRNKLTFSSVHRAARRLASASSDWLHRAPGEDLMVRVDQVDAHLVLARRYSGQVDCIDTTRVRPQPRQVVEVYVQMPDPWRYVERARPEHWYDMHVLHSKSRRCPGSVPRRAEGLRSVWVEVHSRSRGTVSPPSRSVRRRLWRAVPLPRLPPEGAGPSI
jgi:hypothetical protein